MDTEPDHISYLIDKNDRIVFVNNEWDQFAVANLGAELISEKILGRSIWDFISGESLNHVYRLILDRVRTGENFKSDFRCDSPDRRRLFGISISLRDSGDIQFSTRPIHIQGRPEQNIFLKQTTQTSGLVVACSWCNKIKTGDNIWREVEEAVSVLGLFNGDTIPQLSHGLCDMCYKVTMSKLRE